MSNVTLGVGGSLADDSAAFLDAWHSAERGNVIEDRTLAFKSWETLAKLMTGERFRLLRHVHSHPEPSISALGRQYRRVHDDVTALETAGLITRVGGSLEATADHLKAEIQL